MIVLDTNVLVELMREAPHARVIDWVSAQASANLFTTVVSEAEVFFGLAGLPTGRRRKALEEAAVGLFADFDGRILVFDSFAARLCGEICGARQRAGRPISFADAQIAAIARSCDAVVVTRDSSGFAGCGVDVVDPWRS